MTDNVPALAPSAGLLKQTPPPDDVGAETMDRFDWQCAMAAAELLGRYFDRLDADELTDPDSVELICEHHEDWAWIDGDVEEIVSAKHLERAYGTFSTLRQLLEEGGLLHLLDRWNALSRSPRCRVVTTPALSGDAKELNAACEYFAAQDGELELGTQVELLTKLATAIAKVRARVPARTSEGSATAQESETVEVLASFLRVLHISHGSPFRSELRYSASRRYALPLARRIGAAQAADAIWEAMLGVLRERMRAAGPSHRGDLPHVFGNQGDPGLESRTLTMADVATVVDVAIANPEGFRRLPERTFTSKVAVKMGAGGCSDTSIARAEALRLQFRDHWRSINSGPSRLVLQRRVENALHRAADEETDTVRRADVPWGADLWIALRRRADLLVGSPNVEGLDADLLLGGMAELSNRCHLWFSPGFDADEAMRQAAERAAL